MREGTSSITCNSAGSYQKKEHQGEKDQTIHLENISKTDFKNYFRKDP
jgi:hypothetical protein